MHRRKFMVTASAALTLPLLGAGPAAALATAPNEVLLTWYRLVLELVRHTPTYSPPVASRAFAYLGVTAYEAVASGSPGMTSLAGQLNGLTPVPARTTDAFDDGVILHAALTKAVEIFFSNTGPTGQRAMKAMAEKMRVKAVVGVAPDVVARSEAHGQAVAAHICDWSASDGGAVVENMGFPMTYALTKGPAHWVPTSKIVQQQAALLPNWGNNRPFAMKTGDACPLSAPLDYSEDPTSAFYAEAMEVYTTTKALTDDQKKIARFWSDDPMLSPTPPGHWISIALEILAKTDADTAHCADTLARVGIAVADGFIGCWNTKFQYDLLRPVTYIKRVIDPKWEPMLITPPFPEYPSGHSTQSGAAAAVLTAIFGEGFAFSDATHVDDGLPARDFPDFWAAANQAAISRLYGGIHFRAAIERGLEQGRCIGDHVVALRTLA